jgi:precorrin-6Y C5,15-methyltransferase (decarboxylating)
VSPWLAIIGIGEDGLSAQSPAARRLIEEAELLIGGARHLAMVPGGAAERHSWESPLRRTIERIEGWRGRRVAVLASGDPMCYGVGVTLARRFPPDELAILPQPGAFSLAAARLAWPLADCATLTLHGRPLARVSRHLAPGQRILALSEDGATPAAVARLLCTQGWGASEITVLEHLGGARERIFAERAEGFGERTVADLNTVAILCRADAGTPLLSRSSGLPDDAFRSDGQLTKREVRAATLAALAPLSGELLWDVGAGSGSVAIEWLRSGRGTRAIAIERDAARCGFIRENAEKLGVPELRIVEGEAPAAFADLPQPDAVFLGGAVARADLLEQLWARLRPGGRLVANAVTIAGEARLADFAMSVSGSLSRIAVSRAEPIGGQLAWRALRPVTQLAATKKAP